MSLNTFYNRFIDADTIHSLYGMQPPTKKQLDLHNKKVQKVVAQMGHKYRLSRPMPKVAK